MLTTSAVVNPSLATRVASFLPFIITFLLIFNWESNVFFPYIVTVSPSFASAIAFDTSLYSWPFKTAPVSGVLSAGGVTIVPPPVLGLLVELFATFPFGAVISTLPVTVPSTFISTFLSVFIIISSVIVAFGFNTILSLAFAFAKASFNSSTVSTS